MENKDVQKIAKMTIQYAKEIIKPGMNLIDLRNALEKKMLELGTDSFLILGCRSIYFFRR